MTDVRLLYATLAELLSYPDDRLAAAARRASAVCGDPADRWIGPLARFCQHVAGAELSRMQELYTATFDLQPACAPYFGHHLLGEGPMRGPLLAKLVAVYAVDDFVPRDELADHLAEVFRFLAIARPGRTRDELVLDGVLPAMSRMIEAVPDPANPYRDLLVAARALLAAPGPVPERAGRTEVRA